jgi:hypothetical protein
VGVEMLTYQTLCYLEFESSDEAHGVNAAPSSVLPLTPCVQQWTATHRRRTRIAARNIGSVVFKTNADALDHHSLT